MAQGGGTWRIIVEQGKTARPTQSTIVSKRPAVKSQVATSGDSESSVKGSQLVKAGLLAGAVIAKTGFNQYYSITGQGAQRNRTNTVLLYGSALTSIGIQIATGNLIGAAVASIGTGVALGNQYVNFQRDVVEQNAMAEYLRQQSGTSVSSTRGEFYNFNLF
jgi:hypothetical protein